MLPASAGTTFKARPSHCRRNFTALAGPATRRFASFTPIKGTAPFFLKVSFIRPHSPYDPPARWLNEYAELDLPKAVAAGWAAKYAARNSGGPDIWHGRLSDKQIHSSRAAYYGSVSFVDEQIGRILDALETRNLLDETLILFTSDHGDMLGDHHLWRKSYAYQPSARIPMMLRWPEGLVTGKRGQTLSQPVELRDILPTFLQAANQPDRQLDGPSLLRLLNGHSPDWRKYIDLEHDVCYSPENHWSALTDGTWKYIFHARDGGQQLFHLASDPNELIDLSGDRRYGKELNRWRQSLVNHLAERGRPFVVNGDLGLRPLAMTYGRLFPGKNA